MALSRRMLSAMGLEADKIEQIIEAHTETVTGLKQQNADLSDQLAKAKETGSADSDKWKEVQDKYDALVKQVEADNKAREGKDYDALKKEYEDYKAEVQEKAVKSAKEKAVRGLLSDMNMSDKGIYMFMEYGYPKISVELDEDGKPKNATAIRQVVKKDFGEYIPKIETKGADTKQPPTDGKGGASALTKADIYKTDERGRYVMSTDERQQAIAENLELFQ